MPKDTDAYIEARRLLYEGECNCPYWHGVFGGLYLPHLRAAIYDRLIRAEELAEGLTGETVEIRAEDYTMDGHQDFLAATGPARLAIKPIEGGHLFEYDLVDKAYNVLATLTRRREAYHRAVLMNPAKSTAPARRLSAGRDQHP